MEMNGTPWRLASYVCSAGHKYATVEHANVLACPLCGGKVERKEEEGASDGSRGNAGLGGQAKSVYGAGRAAA